MTKRGFPKSEGDPNALRTRAEQIISDMKSRGCKYASYQRGMQTMYFSRTEREGFPCADIDESFVLRDLLESLEAGNDPVEIA